MLFRSYEGRPRSHSSLAPVLQCDHIHLSGIGASAVIASGVIDLSGAFQEEPHSEDFE